MSTAPATAPTALSTTFHQNKEIDRILRLSKSLHFEVLALPLHFTEEDITKQYRSISLLVHPDKAPEGKQEQARVAFTALNEAKDTLSKPDGIKYWRGLVQAAIKEVHDEKIADMTKLKQQELRKNGIKGWEQATVTVEELQKLPNYTTLVRDRIGVNVAAIEFKKAQQARRRQEDVNELKKEEEDAVKKQATTENNVLAVEQSASERAANWRGYQHKARGGRAGAHTVRLQQVPSKDLTHQYKQHEARLNLDKSKSSFDGF